MIRDATVDDLTAIVARGKLHHEELAMPWEYDEISTAKTVVQLIELGTLLVEDERRGYIGYHLEPLYFNHDITLATEDFWYVVPSERKTGLGISLLDAARDKARDQGAVFFSVQLPPQSSAAIDLAKDRGFTLAHGVYGVTL